MSIEVYGPVVLERHTLAAEPLLHHVRGFEEPCARERSVPIHHAVARKPGSNGSIECPANRSGRSASPDILGDVSVGRHATCWDLGEDLPDAFVKGVRRGMITHNSLHLIEVEARSADQDACLQG